MSILRTTFNRSLVRRLARGYASASEPLKKTPLYDFHVQNGAKMVPFAGYSMPLSYGDVGQVASHNHVRTSAGLFDVGHMVQSNFRGETATEFLEWLTPSSLSPLPAYSSTLSLLLSPSGGILDDLIITKHSPTAYYLVTNAGRRAHDLAHFQSHLAQWNAGALAKKRGGVDMEVLEGWGLVALQGPRAAGVLQGLTGFDLGGLVFGRSAWVGVEGGFNVHVARGGYTGEDGFEISIPPSQTTALTSLLLSSSSSPTSQPTVALTGLAARDSLRLEAGMCLYGSDLSPSISPIQAGLAWVIGRDRRDLAAMREGEGGEMMNTWIGADSVLAELKKGPSKRRVGLVVEGAPARAGAKIFSSSSPETQIGVVTSGIPSPTLGKNIAMGYIDVNERGEHKKGSVVEVEVRGRRGRGEVVGMPFVPVRYYRG